MVLSYLTKNYELDILQKEHVGIYPKSDDKTDRELRYGRDLLKELVTIFSLSEGKLIELVGVWAKGKDLDFYWDYTAIFFPNVANITASLIGQDLVAVQPMAGPTGNLHYIDFVYSGATEPNSNGRLYEEININNTITSWNIQRLADEQQRVIGVSSKLLDDNLEV